MCQLLLTTSLGAQQVVHYMQEAEQRMEHAAAEINRNRIDAHEIIR